MALFQALGGKLTSTNMLLEGLLARIKASSPWSRKRGGPEAERLAYSGLLTQLLPAAKRRVPLDELGARRGLARCELVSKASGHDVADGGPRQEPIGTDALAELVDDALPGTGRRSAGFAFKGKQVRDKFAPKLVVDDDEAMIPRETKFHWELHCDAAHPGLCASAHSAIYDQALLLADAIRKFFTKDDVGTFFVVDTAQGNMVVGLVHVRARRVHCQTTHVFVPCFICGDDDNVTSAEPGAAPVPLREGLHGSASGTVELCSVSTSSGEPALAFWSLWRLARHLCEFAPSSQLSAASLVVQHQPGTLLRMKVRRVSDARPFWPVPGRQVNRKTAAERALDEVAGEPRAQRKKGLGSVGVAVIRPRGPTPAAPPEEEDASSSETNSDGWPSVPPLASSAHEGAAPAPVVATALSASTQQEAAPAPIVATALSASTHQEAAPAPRAPREPRGLPWGPFQIAEVFAGGAVKAMGAICARHRDEGHARTACKKQLALGSGRNALSKEECARKLKRWLLKGFDIPASDVLGRTLHVAQDARYVDAGTDEDLDRDLAAKMAIVQS